jgi:O-antigen/teichoic acid export membrane protein
VDEALLFGLAGFAFLGIVAIALTTVVRLESTRARLDAFMWITVFLVLTISLRSRERSALEGAGATDYQVVAQTGVIVLGLLYAVLRLGSPADGARPPQQPERYSAERTTG